MSIMTTQMNAAAIMIIERKNNEWLGDYDMTLASGIFT